MRRFSYIIIFLFIAANVMAQHRNSSQNSADSQYNEAKIFAQNGEGQKAVCLLLKILRNDPDYYMAWFGLADLYHESGELKLEQEALVQGLKVGSDHFPNGYKYLAALLYDQARYSEALKNIEQFNRLKNRLTSDENRLLESCRYAVKAVESPVDFHPVNAGAMINSAEDEYWPSLDAEANILVFTRLIKEDRNGRKLAYPQEDFFVSRKDSEVWQMATPLGPPINTPENEGAQCISADGRLLFFTGCGRPDGMGSCDIYMSVKQGGKWSEPVNLGAPVNTNAWESQPSVSADGHWLYFTSNRTGGKGKMDIWKAEKQSVTPEGYPVYGKVENLERVNTPGNDLSPFIHADGKTLYFASDYWPGMGGKDLFYIRLDSTNKMPPQNLGYPINTSADEEGLIVEVSGEKGWYTVNNKGFGGRDIYSFPIPQPFRPDPVSWVKGRVLNRKNGMQISSEIVLNDLVTNKLIQHQYPFENEGEFLFCLPAGHNYGLNISKAGYLFHSENFNLINAFIRQKPLNLEIALDPIESGKSVILKNIFFDTDSFNLKPESKGQLAEIWEFMKGNPGLVIEIGGHTDDQGSESHNLILSEQRADAVVQFLIAHGISSGRLKSHGYGFSVPLTDNLTEVGRAKNRRTEFRILEERQLDKEINRNK